MTNVMAVASTDSSDAQSSFSNRGSYIEIAAPGSSVYSTYFDGGYTTMSGTSMATPHVAGLAALIWSQNSGWTNRQVRAQIRATAEDLGTSGWDSQFGYGRIDAAAAMGVRRLPPPAEASTGPVSLPRRLRVLKPPTFRARYWSSSGAGFTANKVIGQVQLGAVEVRVAGTIDQIGVRKLGGDGRPGAGFIGPVAQFRRGGLRRVEL